MTTQRNQTVDLVAKKLGHDRNPQHWTDEYLNQVTEEILTDEVRQWKHTSLELDWINTVLDNAYSTRRKAARFRNDIRRAWLRTH